MSYEMSLLASQYSSGKITCIISSACPISAKINLEFFLYCLTLFLSYLCFFPPTFFLCPIHFNF